MKNLFRNIGLALLLVLGLTFSLTSCEDYREVKKEIAEINRQCPINEGGVIITSVTFDESDKIVVYNALVQEGSVSVSKLRGHEDMMKKGVVLGMLKEMKTAKMFADKGLGIRYTYANSNSAAKVSVDLSNDDLQAIADGTYIIDGRKCADVDQNLLMLENLVAMDNLQYPMEETNGVRPLRERLTSEALVIDCSFNESEFTIPQLLSVPGAEAEVKAEMRQDMLKYFSDNEKTVHTMLQYCKWCDRAITYNYIGSRTDKSLEVTITTSDLTNLLYGN